MDLPGLARVATEGQRPDVPELTRRLSKTFIEPSQSIVLVVCACNADLATAEALRLAAEADPDGERTVGVLTKPDLMDPGTESSVQDILRGKVVKLERHGYFVVRNRGQLSRNVTQGQALPEVVLLHAFDIREARAEGVWRPSRAVSGGVLQDTAASAAQPWWTAKNATSSPNYKR